MSQSQTDQQIPQQNLAQPDIVSSIQHLISPHSKPNCLADLSPDQISRIIGFIKANYDYTRIARIIQGAWKACTDVTEDTVRHAIADFTDRLNGVDVDVSTPAGRITQPISQQPVPAQPAPPPPVVTDLPAPIAPYESHNPIGSIYSLIRKQFDRLEMLIAKEKEEGQTIPEIGRIVESLKGLNREFVQLRDAEDPHGNTPESKQSAVIIEQMNVLVQELKDRDNVAVVATNFTKSLEELAVPMLMESPEVQKGHDSPYSESSIIDIEPINTEPTDPIDINEQHENEEPNLPPLPPKPKKRGRPAKTADDHERDSDNKAVGSNSKSRARVKKLLRTKKS